MSEIIEGAFALVVIAIIVVAFFVSRGCAV